MQRRAALQLLGGIVAAGLPGSKVFASIRRAPGLGIQLYTLRAQMREDFEGTLARVAAIGYREVEFAGWFGRSPADVRRILADNGLSAPAAHVDILAVTETLDQTLDAAGEVGLGALIVPSLPRELTASLDGYRRAAGMLGSAVERAEAAGIAIGYHNHASEFVALDGGIPMDAFVGALPASVFLELDVFWAAKGGADPVVLMNRLGRRVRMIHAKDMDAAGNMVNVGAGTVDFDAILGAGRTHGLEHVFIEHDQPADAFETARAGFVHLQPKIR